MELLFKGKRLQEQKKIRAQRRLLRKLLMIFMNTLSEKVPDQIFNNNLANYVRQVAKHRSTIISHSKSLHSLIGLYEKEAGFKEGAVMSLVSTFQAQITQDSEKSEESSDHTSRSLQPYLNNKGPHQITTSRSINSINSPPLDYPDQASNLQETTPTDKRPLIKKLYEQGAFLHKDFRIQALEQGVAFIKKATDLLFKLPHVNNSEEANLIHSFKEEGITSFYSPNLKSAYLKLLLQRGPDYLNKIGVNVPILLAYDWIHTGIKPRTHSGRPVQNLALDMVAMSSVYAMVNRGLLPHFDFLIAKQIAGYLDGNNEVTRSEGWKPAKNYEYFSYPIPDENQSEFIEVFKRELHSKARYLSYKKKSLYAWLYAN